MIQTVLLFILGLILICLGGDRLVDAAVAIAKKLGIPEIVVAVSYTHLDVYKRQVMVQQFWEQEEVLKRRFLERGVDLRPVMVWH